MIEARFLLFLDVKENAWSKSGSSIVKYHANIKGVSHKSNWWGINTDIYLQIKETFTFRVLWKLVQRVLTFLK